MNVNGAGLKRKQPEEPHAAETSNSAEQGPGQGQQEEQPQQLRPLEGEEERKKQKQQPSEEGAKQQVPEQQPLAEAGREDGGQAQPAAAPAPKQVVEEEKKEAGQAAKPASAAADTAPRPFKQAPGRPTRPQLWRGPPPPHRQPMPPPPMMRQQHQHQQPAMPWQPPPQQPWQPAGEPWQQAPQAWQAPPPPQQQPGMLWDAAPPSLQAWQQPPPLQQQQPWDQLAQWPAPPPAPPPQQPWQVPAALAAAVAGPSPPWQAGAGAGVQSAPLLIIPQAQVEALQAQAAPPLDPNHPMSKLERDVPPGGPSEALLKLAVRICSQRFGFGELDGQQLGKVLQELDGDWRKGRCGGHSVSVLLKELDRRGLVRAREEMKSGKRVCTFTNLAC